MSSNQPRSFTSASQSQTQYKRKAPDSNVNIDYVPGDNGSKGQYKGGEYVDYEEVK
jgi:hypothetical protein